MHLRFDERTLTLINLLTDTQVLVDVSVQYQPYQFVKEAALEELKKKVDALQRNINLVSARSILTELAAAEYRWSPSLEALEPMLATPEDKQLAAFLLGGLIFTGFAQQMDGEHLLQPKRSRLFLEASFDVMTDRQELEQGLFAELKERAQTALVDVPWLPTFFPYLLTRCNTPMEMLQEVVHLRQSGEVKDYRVLLRNIMDMQQQNGRIPVEMEKEIAKIVKLIDTQLGKIPSMPKVDASVSIVNVATGTLPGRVDPTPWLERQWGWFLASLPAHRHRKLLTRVVIAEREYKNLDRRVKKVWQAG